MNLLPKQDKDILKKEKTARLLVVSSAAVLLILFVAIALLIPTYLFLTLQSSELSRQLEIERQSTELKRSQNIEGAIKDLNARIDKLENGRKLTRDVSQDISMVIEKKPASIILTRFIYKQTAQDAMPTLSVSGHAVTREILLKFVEELDKSGNFAGVHSPISNILSRSDVEFSIDIDLEENEKI